MSNYDIIYNSIVRCKGKVVTFIYDTESSQFIDFILEDLKNDYKIINSYDLDNNNLKNNSIVLLKNLGISELNKNPDPMQRIMYRKNMDNHIRSLTSKIWDQNIIIIILSNNNSNFFGYDVYAADTVFLLKNNELSFLKKRTVDYETDKFNISQLIRSIKLKRLGKV